MPIVEKEMPKTLSKDEQILWCRNKLLSLYQYDKIPPDWVQDETWPIYNGLPMVFTHQENKGEEEIYYFIDRKSGKKKAIKLWW